MQSALLHGAGQYSALVSYDLDPGSSPAAARAVAAQIIALSEGNALPPSLRVLVGLGSSVLNDHPPFADVADRADADAVVGPGRAMVVQVAAACEEHRALVFRVLDELTAGVFTHGGEILGGKLLNNQEHFGFPDGEPPTAAAMVEALDSSQAVPPDAKPQDAVDVLRESRRGIWLFHLQIRQNLADFMRKSEAERTDLMGRVPGHVSSPAKRAELAARVATSKTPSNAHWNKMRAGGKPAMLRRGFPSRHAGASGLTFLSASERVSAFRGAYQAMQSGDALLPFVAIVAGGAYFCPPDADWLVQGTRAPALTASVASLVRFSKLTSYPIAESFLSYMQALLAAGLFEGEVGQMQPAFDVQPHLDDIYAALEARNPGLPKGRLLSLQREAERDANAINADLGQYLTIS